MESRLGLTSTGQCVGVIVVGLCCAPFGVGILLIVWGVLAYIQLSEVQNKIPKKHTSTSNRSALRALSGEPINDEPEPEIKPEGMSKKEKALDALSKMGK